MRVHSYCDPRNICGGPHTSYAALHPSNNACYLTSVLIVGISSYPEYVSYMHAAI